MNIIIKSLVAIIVTLSFVNPTAFSQTSAGHDKEVVNYMDLSSKLVSALKSGESGAEEVAIFASSSLADIASQITTDDQKLAFWINIYNGYIIHILQQHPEYYDDRRAFFSAPYIEIAGQEMSFADIEHGILRRGQKGWGLGYIGSIFSPRYQRKLRPKKRDYKIHFGLNCGAKSCPPVAIYTADNVHEQLCTRQTAYLRQETTYDEANNKVVTSTLMSWFRGDFGGKSGTKDILLREGLIPNKKVELGFGDYDWLLDLDNYTN